MIHHFELNELWLLNISFFIRMELSKFIFHSMILFELLCRSGSLLSQLLLSSSFLVVCFFQIIPSIMNDSVHSTNLYLSITEFISHNLVCSFLVLKFQLKGTPFVFIIIFVQVLSISLCPGSFTKQLQYSILEAILAIWDLSLSFLISVVYHLVCFPDAISYIAICIIFIFTKEKWWSIMSNCSLLRILCFFQIIGRTGGPFVSLPYIGVQMRLWNGSWIRLYYLLPVSVGWMCWRFTHP